MNVRRKLLAVLLMLAIVLSMAVSVSAQSSDDAAADCVRQIVNYYSHYQDDARVDIACLLNELSQIDPKQAQAWSSIMEYWSYINTDMTLHPGVLPDGLPQDDSLCIVVLGYALYDGGGMRPELVGRLETALKSAEKYPNALIACTGGGSQKVSEAKQMSRWLIGKGIAQERIIVEDKSMSTVGNARYTCQILTESYPQVTHLALITSDYHLYRASLLFHTQCTLSAVNDGAPQLCVAANAAFETGQPKESFDFQLDNFLKLTEIDIQKMDKPSLSKLSSIAVSGTTQYAFGAGETELDLTVLACYDTGRQRDVSRQAQVSGLNFEAAGIQEVTVTYEEGGIQVSSVIEIEILPAPTEPPTEPPAEPPTEVSAVNPLAPVFDFLKTLSPGLLVLIGIIVLLVLAEILIIIRLIQIRKAREAAKAAEKEEAVKLPDDDSPVEYI